MRRLLVYSGLLLIVLAGAILAFVYSGVYNVAATEQHTRPIYWTLRTVVARSVEERSPEFRPPDLSNAELVARGVRLYRGHCRQCHGAPGVPPEDFAKGMTPVPPNLMRAARSLEAGDIFWAVKNGIKMTGMPAWDYRIEDDAIWAIVAFVKEMAVISPARYREMAEEAGEQQPSGPDEPAAAAAAPQAQGDPERGRVAIRQYACISCHEVPGVVGRQIRVGPRLDGIAERQFIAGVLPNTPENMVRWIRQPEEIDPLTAMPNMGVSEAHARDIAAYLYELSR